MGILKDSYLTGIKLALMSEHGRKRGRRAEKAGPQGARAGEGDYIGPAEVMEQQTGIHPAALEPPTPPESTAGHEAAASGKFDAALKNIAVVDPQRAKMYKRQLTRILRVTGSKKGKGKGAGTVDKSLGPKPSAAVSAGSMPAPSPIASPIAPSAVGGGRGCK